MSLADPIPGLAEALGQSDAFLALMERLSEVARVNRPVLLLGERGTGKELAAARLHYRSPRWEGPFVTVSAAALPRSLLEAELFGHEAGAFTGAVRRRIGRFEAAHTGTLFLDEIQAAPLPVQEKLLRAVEYGTVERLGASASLRLDVRVVAAANVDLRQLVRRGRFRADLLDRLAFEVIHLPPLRRRQGDIPYLAERFAARFAAELGRPDPPRFSSRAMAALCAHHWPGNIRELKNVVERAVFRNPHRHIAAVAIDPFDHSDAPPAPPAPDDPAASAPIPAEARKHALPTSFHAAVDVFQMTLLRQALARAGGNQRRASEALGLSYHQFRGLYRKFAERLTSEERSP